MPTAPTHPFRIIAADRAAAEPGPFDLVVEGSAFGRGTHPTTASCLAVLAGLAPLDGLRVLDVGSGSGILALAALRLGAAGAVCLDVNPDAVASARRSGVASGLDGRLAHRCGDVDDLAGASFDLVLANIGGELLLDQADRVAALAAPGGRLLLSGLQAGWGDALAVAYGRLGCTVLERRAAGEFCTVLLAR